MKRLSRCSSLITHHSPIASAPLRSSAWRRRVLALLILAGAFEWTVQCYSQEPKRDSDDTAQFLSARAPGGRQLWREYNLNAYTSRQNSAARPEQAVVDWIIRQTGEDAWHGEDVAVLSAGRGKLRVFHVPDVQDQVTEIVDRFVRPVQWQVAMKFELLACTDLNWRSGLVHLMKPVVGGQEGQQIWVMAPEDAALVRERLRRGGQARVIRQQSVAASNGQSATIEAGQPVSYVSGLQLAGGAFTAYNPVIGRLDEGIKLHVTPLWTADGRAVEARFLLATRAVRKLHTAQSAAPLNTGNQNTTVQVPEVSATALDQTLRWPTSQVLVISAGVQPPMRDSKRGLLNMSGSPTELVVIAELEPPTPSRGATARTPTTDSR